MAVQQAKGDVDESAIANFSRAASLSRVYRDLVQAGVAGRLLVPNVSDLLAGDRAVTFNYRDIAFILSPYYSFIILLPLLAFP